MIVGRRVGDGGKHACRLGKAARVGLGLMRGHWRSAVADVGTLHELVDADAGTAAVGHLRLVLRCRGCHRSPRWIEKGWLLLLLVVAGLPRMR